MNNLKNLFKQPSARFSYSIESALKEAVAEKEQKRNPSFKTKILVACLVLLIALPTSALAGINAYKLMAERIGDYGAHITTNTNDILYSPKYVKLNVQPLNGYKAMTSDGLKYCRVGEDGNFAFSFMLSRPQSGAKSLYTNVSDFEKVTINGHEAIIFTGSGLRKNTRVSIYFEDVNIIAKCYVDADIDRDIMLKFMDGVDVVEGTRDDHTVILNISDFSGNEVVSINEDKYIPVNEGEKIIGHNELLASVSNIQIVDNVASLNREDFYFYGDDISDYISSDGSLLPRLSEIYKFGDGINTTDELISSEKIEQKFILADVEYTNNTSKEIEFSIGLRMVTLQKNNGTLSPIISNDINADDGYAQYIENASDKLKKYHLENPDKKFKKYYIYKLSPGESITLTAGFRCDENMLDNAYLVMETESNSGRQYSSIKVK